MTLQSRQAKKKRSDLLGDLQEIVQIATINPRYSSSLGPALESVGPDSKQLDVKLASF